MVMVQENLRGIEKGSMAPVGMQNAQAQSTEQDNRRRDRRFHSRGSAKDGSHKNLSGYHVRDRVL